MIVWRTEKYHFLPYWPGKGLANHYKALGPAVQPRVHDFRGGLQIALQGT